VSNQSSIEMRYYIGRREGGAGKRRRSDLNGESSICEDMGIDLRSGQLDERLARADFRFFQEGTGGQRCTGPGEGEGEGGTHTAGGHRDTPPWSNDREGGEGVFHSEGVLHQHSRRPGKDGFLGSKGVGWGGLVDKARSAESARRR